MICDTLYIDASDNEASAIWGTLEVEVDDAELLEEEEDDDDEADDPVPLGACSSLFGFEEADVDEDVSAWNANNAAAPAAIPIKNSCLSLILTINI